MKEYIASVKDKTNGEVKIIRTNEYKNKTEFAKDLRNNDYSVRFISTEENFDRDCEKYHENLEMQKRIYARCK